MSEQLNEALRAKDLQYFVSDLFTVDTYKSKMGEDRDVAVIGFRVKDRLPAIDLMEFIERGYEFVLDADLSSGEDSDGQYSVFVEIERGRKLPRQIAEMLSGISKLTGIDDWRYRYHQEWRSKEFSEQSLTEDVPLDPNSYDIFLHESRVNTIKTFLDKAAFADIVIEGNVVTFSRAFTDGIKFELLDIGPYKTVMERNEGAVKLDEQAVAETVFLNKVFGDYEIIKLGQNFLVRKDQEALLIKTM